ncbi:hypothetical protein [Shinella sp. NM-101]|uniref:hypothetical protein n=1 Tax=Shinella sp. NM-101 TaxID=2744455 RepID=UPI001F4489FE|nr:hypothetical protein [Shinella sp. NM-101]
MATVLRHGHERRVNHLSIRNFRKSALPDRQSGRRFVAHDEVSCHLASVVEPQRPGADGLAIVSAYCCQPGEARHECRLRVEGHRDRIDVRRVTVLEPSLGLFDEGRPDIPKIESRRRTIRVPATTSDVPMGVIEELNAVAKG